MKRINKRESGKKNRVEGLWICCTLLLILALGCKDEQRMYQYFDGSGNDYRISGPKEAYLEYSPVTPELSSSGIYDGGEPAKVELSASRFKTIERALHRALKNTKAHIPNRLMGSGQIRAGETRVILSADSREKKELEELLQKILKE